MALPKPSGEFEWVQESWGAALRCAPLGPVAPHCFSTRELPLDGARDEDQAGWEMLARAFGVSLSSLVRMRQVHGAGVFEASSVEEGVAAGEGVGRGFLERERGKPLPTPFPPAYDDWPEGDIAVSRSSSFALSVRAADCVPILLGDCRTGAVAAVHAGWRGTAAGAVMEAVRALRASYGSDPVDLVGAVGPSIGPCCYEVGDDLVQHFAAHPEAARWFSGDSKPRLNLWRATRDQLERAGVPPSQIHVCELCTSDHPALFHSYRRDGTRAGRLVAAIRSRAGDWGVGTRD